MSQYEIPTAINTNTFPPLQSQSQCPVQNPSKNSFRKSSQSPLRKSLRSPLRQLSRSPIWRSSRSTLRRSSRSPIRSSSRSSLQRFSRSPRRRSSRSPRRRSSRSPLRRSSRSPLRRSSRSPLRWSSRSPLRRPSRSPLRRSSRSPRRRSSRSPLRRSLRSPVQYYSKNSLRRTSRSPKRRFSRSPLRRSSPSWSRRRRRSPLKRSTKNTLRKTSRKTSLSPLQKSPQSNKNPYNLNVNLENFKYKDDCLQKDNKSRSSLGNKTSESLKEDNCANEQQTSNKSCCGNKNDQNCLHSEQDIKSAQKSVVTKSAKKKLGQKTPKPSNKAPNTKDRLSAVSNLNRIFQHNLSDNYEPLNEKNSVHFIQKEKKRENEDLKCDSKVADRHDNFEPLKSAQTYKDISGNDSTVLEQFQSYISLQDSLTHKHTSNANVLQNIAKGSTTAFNEVNQSPQSNEISSSFMSCETSKGIHNANESFKKSNAKTVVPNDLDDSLIKSRANEFGDTYKNENEDENVSEERKSICMNPAFREFDILDDLDDSDHDEEDDDGYDLGQTNSSENEVENNEEISLEDIDAMLEEGLPEKFKDSAKKSQSIKLKRKIVLEEIGHDHFDLLPEGWIQIMHSSGMPVYLHQKSRVCTMTRPYYLGPGSSRNHKVPLSAIPCLQYRRALEIEKKKKEEKEKNHDQNQHHPEIKLMSAHIETFEENEAAQSLEIPDLHEYCKKVFNFKTLTLIPFKSWSQRRKFSRTTRDFKRRQRPTLPGGTKLLKFPIQNAEGGNKPGEWIINPNGKSYVCILHEYVQHALRKHPKYRFSELENPATPYSATVFIEDLQYGVGVGASKKQAKVEAAKAALEVLIPEMKEKIERDSEFGMRSGIAKRSEDKSSDISIFDQIRVEDPRVAEFCAKTTEPPPYAILLTCLSRNMGLGEIKVHYEMNSKHHKQDEFTMIVGNHKATVVCKNKREGKQRAAQAILQALHPNITHWGSLLRMYGNGSIKNAKEKKQEEQEITGLQSKASLNQPNYAILEKLRTEMLKLKNRREAMTAKGKFTLPENVVLPSLSSTDLNKVNLV